MFFASYSTCSLLCLPAPPFLQFLLGAQILWSLRCAEDSDSFSSLLPGFRSCCLRACWLLHASRTETPAPSYFLQIGPDSPPPGESLGCKHRDIDPTENQDQGGNKKLGRNNAKYFLTLSPPWSYCPFLPAQWPGTAMVSWTRRFVSLHTSVWL